MISIKKLVCLFMVLLLTAGCAKPKDTSSEVTVEKYQTEFFDTFDTHTTVTCYVESQEEFDHISGIIHDEMLRMHQLFDIYNSYEGINNIKTINDNAGMVPVEVDPILIELLVFSRQAYADTDGAVNIALGPVLSIWHQYRDAGLENPEQSELPPMELLQEANKYTNFSLVEIDEQDKKVFLPEQQMSLDVGALAKGFAVQSAVDKAIDAGLTSGLINAGGNVAVIGKPADDRDAWNVGVQLPDYNSGQQDIFDLLKISSNCAIVSSGDYQRYYYVDGTAYHHIIDPNTLMPAQQFRAVSIVHPDSAIADMLSTMAFILPYDKGRELVLSHGGEAVWIFSDGRYDYTDGYEEISSRLQEK